MDSAFRVGPYTVRLTARAADAQAMPLYYVYRDGEYIGKSLSLPSEGDCDWLAKHASGGSLYASVTVKDDGDPHKHLFRRYPKRRRK